MQFAGFISSVDGFNIGGENNLKTLWRNNGLPANSLLHTPIYVHFKLQQINIRISITYAYVTCFLKYIRSTSL